MLKTADFGMPLSCALTSSSMRTSVRCNGLNPVGVWVQVGGVVLGVPDGGDDAAAFALPGVVHGRRDGDLMQIQVKIGVELGGARLDAQEAIVRLTRGILVEEVREAEPGVAERVEITLWVGEQRPTATAARVAERKRRFFML